MKKYYNDKGQVGVLVSDSHKGWSTENERYANFLIFDSELIKHKLNPFFSFDLEEYCYKYTEACEEDLYLDGWIGVKVVWVDKSEVFTIIECELGEKIVLVKDLTFTA